MAASLENPEEALEQKHMDLAASIQAATEEIMLKLTRNIAKITGQNNLCLAGGVALNCVANGKMLETSAMQKRHRYNRRQGGRRRGAMNSTLCLPYVQK